MTKVAKRNHEHEPETKLDKNVTCRVCGKPILEHTSKIATTQSMSRAYKIMFELAAAGDYCVSSIMDGYPVFTKDTAWGSEEIHLIKEGDRKFSIEKVTKHVDK